MNNKEAKKMINNKLKLYRNAKVGEVAIGIASFTAGIAASYYISEGIINSTTNFYLKITSIPFAAFLASSVCVIPLVSSITINNNKSELEVLKMLKKELKNGNNRFSNTNKENFDVELSLVAKQYTKNKVK